MLFLEEYENNIIYCEETIIEALRKLNCIECKVLFVVDSSNTLKGTVTDGDVRRAILSGISLDKDVYSIASQKYIYMTVDNANHAALLIKEKQINAVPLVDNNGVIKKIYVNKKSHQNTKRKIDVPVVIMAGGQGKRLYPFTKILPKPLIPIEDTPISERIIQSFIDLGCQDFYMIVNYKKNMIKSYFSDADVKANIYFVDEDIPLGTGGGLKLLDNKLHGTFVMTNCDILILEDLSNIIKHHKDTGNEVTMVCSLKNFEIPYGIVNFSEGGDIESFQEKPKMSFFTNTGYYILEDSVMNYINESENIGMPDIIERMKADGRKVGIYPISESAWLDMGQFDSMEGMVRKIKELKLSE